ncbi:CRISPR-associated endonuclease Cas3'' [Metallosphaera tengchongensis]|uniref:CRISPR-associated endonuclease Cas3 n=1 Tax=Metallosphaera tengchongensis TaxID=1532350 RepID=A0A6N0NV37_9CREN|nr:CRISPR-associated endonuclease Cas3'' [Metallosphaera tengchongensis]QKR00724.1 CRISPR-associated endonuclease Cas3'' [Metallosphaera tengchongensis]
MKPCAFHEQELTSHAKGSVDQMLTFFDDHYFTVLHRKLNHYLRKLGSNLDLDPQQVKELVKFLTAFHDIGKAAEEYQVQFDDACRAKGEKTSFVYHEVGGALFLWYNRWEDEFLKVMSVMSVLNHLNAIRGLHNLNESKVKPGHLKLGRYGSAFLSQVIDQTKVRNPFMTTYEVRDYEKYEVQDMVSQLSSFASSKLELKYYVLLLTPIIVGDNLDSSSQRKKDQSYKSKSRFITAIETEVKSS